MSLFNLATLVSKEDFADAHEPVNDGVKEVPNAQTIAASVKTSDTGTDTTNAGPAKIIPEKEETGDNTEKQFDTVSESSEKGGASSSTPPAQPSEKPAADKADTSTDESSTPKEGSEPVDAPLEHETKEAAEDEQKKTETVTKSLEDYGVHATRFDVVGYPKADREKLQKRMNWLARRTGNDTNVVISAESISSLVTAGKERVIHLNKQIEAHTKRKASLESIGDIPYTPSIAEPEAETSIGNIPADGITAIEVDPLDVGINTIAQVEQTLDVLQNSQIALEHLTKIIRGKPYISQQAAAVLQTGLDHIDRVCGLKVRATGLEGYEATPRAAMAKAVISIESLDQRAAEIGAKVLKWIKELLARADTMWEKYKSGLTTAITNAESLRVKIDGLKGAPSRETINLKTNSFMYLGDEFVGDHVDKSVLDIPKFLLTQYKGFRSTFIGDITAALTNGGDDALETITGIVEQYSGNSTGNSIELPGDCKLESNGLVVKFEHDKPSQPPEAEVKVFLDRTKMRREIDQCVKTLNALASDDVLNLIKQTQESVAKALIAFRKGAGKDLDETERQKVQTYVMEQVSKSFNVTEYFQTIKYAAQQVSIVMKVHKTMADAWSAGGSEE